MTPEYLGASESDSGADARLQFPVFTGYMSATVFTVLVPVCECRVCACEQVRFLPHGTCVLGVIVWQQQVSSTGAGQGVWAGALATGAQLETPHVPHHCCGIERLLQKTRHRYNNNKILIT